MIFSLSVLDWIIEPLSSPSETPTKYLYYTFHSNFKEPGKKNIPIEPPSGALTVASGAILIEATSVYVAGAPKTITT